MSVEIQENTRLRLLIEKAEARIRQLNVGTTKATGRLMAQGVEIKIERPSFRGRDYVSRSYEIIPYSE